MVVVCANEDPIGGERIRGGGGGGGGGVARDESEGGGALLVNESFLLASHGCVRRLGLGFCVGFAAREIRRR